MQQTKAVIVSWFDFFPWRFVLCSRD